MNLHNLAKRCATLFAIVVLTGSVLWASAEETHSPADIQIGDVICFGKPEETSGFDGKWLVLDPSQTNMETDGMFVTTLNLVGSDTGDPLLFREIGDVSVSFSDRG